MFSIRSLAIASVAITLTMTAPCHADVRSEAIAIQAKLRQEGIASKLPDEIKSLDAAIAEAEGHFAKNDLTSAEKFYLLAIQKGRLIESVLAGLDQPQPPHASPANTAQPTPQPVTQDPPAKALMVPADEGDPLANIQSDQLIGSYGTYVVAKNDTIRLVAAKLGMSRSQLAAMNGLDPKAPLREGQELRYNNRRIIAKHVRDGIVINIPDRTLYYFEKGRLVTYVPVALGTPNKTENFVWHTPTGRFKIIDKQKDPTWTVPPSIQEEMRLEGKEVITSIPPGPDNPLGKYAMKTSLPGILIHSTTKPWSIYTYASHGCIRVFPEKMEHLFKQIRIHTKGEIIYQPVKLAVTESGRVLLEAHGDIYAKTKGVDAEARRLIKQMNLADRVDWNKVKKVTSKKAGVAFDVTLDTMEAQQSARTQLPSPS